MIRKNMGLCTHLSIAAFCSSLRAMHSQKADDRLHLGLFYKKLIAFYKAKNYPRIANLFSSLGAAAQAYMNTEAKTKSKNHKGIVGCV